MTSLIAAQQELKSTHDLCALLMKTPHYQKMGQEGIFAIVETARCLGIDPRIALGGGLYFVKGKVEMSARMMNSLIRQKGHSIMRDEKSDDKKCILHGRRADNGDTWTESFSIEEAQRAGLAGKDVWKNFGRDMLFARALSRLARQLFPDVIGNTYVENEIALDDNIKEIPAAKPAQVTPPSEVIEIHPTLSDDQIKEIIGHPAYTNEFAEKIFEAFKISAIGEVDQKYFEPIIKRLNKTLEKNEEQHA